MPGAGARGKDVVVTITAKTEAKDRLHFNCTECQTVCPHIGAAVSLILEEKTALGLAAAPQERVPIESLSEEALVEQALSDRAGAGANGEISPAIRQSQDPVGGLRRHQRRVGQDLPRGAAGRRTG